MGVRGPIAKPEEERQRSASPIALVMPETDEVLETPPPPKGLGLRKEARDVWQALWESDVAQAWDRNVDLPIVERYIAYYSQWLQAMKQLEQQGYETTGSQGQDVLAPVTKWITQIEKELRALENQLGLSPMARARLGLTIGEAKLTAEYLNQMLRRRRD